MAQAPVPSTFTIDGVDVAAGVGLDSGTGLASFDTTTLSAGTHTIAVTYSGDGNYAPGSGALSPDQIIDHTPTTTVLVSDAEPSESGQPVTFTATVSSVGGIPSGMVDFTDEGADLGTTDVGRDRHRVDHDIPRPTRVPPHQRDLRGERVLR